MAQLLLHLIGDYLLQSGWMAANKAKSHIAAFVHALVYSLPFLLLRPSLNAWLVIFVNGLVNRIDTMNNDIVKIDAMVSVAFNRKPNLERLAAADGKEDSRKD